MDGYKSGKYGSVREAARITGIPKTTIGARLKGRPTRRKGQEANQKLAHAEEDEVARQVRIATVAGKLLQPAVVKQIAEGVRKRRVKGVNENGAVLVEYEPLGVHWLRRFKGRQRTLSTERVEKIEAVRNEVTVEDLEKWFVELECVITEYHILSENIYNMDETGSNIGDN